METTWEKKLNSWYRGLDLPTYPEYIKNQFFFETSPISKTTHQGFEITDGCLYGENFIESSRLNSQNEDSSSFDEYLFNPKTKYSTSFYNLSKTSMLIIPTKVDGGEFTSLKLFIDSASNDQQKALWCMVAEEAEKMLEMYDKIWISTHGLGVPYLHIRIDTVPKYYQTKRFK